MCGGGGAGDTLKLTFKKPAAYLYGGGAQLIKAI